MKATITVDDSDNELVSIFEAELKTTVNDRASYAVSHADGVSTFEVTAKDMVALRATLNAITKQLVVYDKRKSLEN